MDVHTLRAALIHYLQRESVPMPRDSVCRELGRFGAVSDEIPEAPPWEWSQAISELVAEGAVTETKDGLLIDRDWLAEETRKSKGMLF